MFSDDDDLYYYTGGDYYDTDDSGPYYDDDDYYDDYNVYDSDHEAFRYARRVADYGLRKEKEKLSKEEEDENNADNTPKVFQCSSLVDICAGYLALNFPFAYLQDRFPPIPDDLQLKVIKFSFPDSEEKIRKYAEFSRSGADINYPSRLCSSGQVKDMMQIGFRLSASVDDKYVTIHFDRGKITSAQCTCESSSSWCLHVIATALMRIRNANCLDKSQMRLPVSDALNVLSREQLLKFSQYLLYHHQNQKIVETAQGLIDKLVNRHGDYDEEQINVIDGAPDPTAGPGLDEDCHWFVCTKGFKESCSNLIYEPTDNLGFAPLENRDDSSLLHELWYRSRCNFSLVQDDIDTEVSAEFYCPYSLERRQDSSRILETVLELIKDDSMSGLIAIKSCTEQLLSRLEKKTSPYESRRLRSSSSQDVTKPQYPCGSQAMGFTARPFRCWTLCDELSVLWQLSILNPRMNARDKQQVSLELMKWNEEAATGCYIEKLKPWKGLEVAYNLCQYIDWQQPHMQAILHDTIPPNYTINGCTLVHVNTDSTTDKNHPAISCHLPYSFNYGSTTLDIHTWCSIINALQVQNYKKPAIHIAFGLALGFISLYRNHVDTRTRFSNIPVLVSCTLEHNSKCSSDTAQDDGDESMEIDELMEHGITCPEIWPVDTLLSVRCFAFLYEFLSSNNDEVESLITLHKQMDSPEDSEMATFLDTISCASSLRFQTAAIGLFLPRFPMAVMRQEAEQYDLENWLSSQLLESKPTSDDMAFLNHLCEVALNDGSHWPLAPPSSFTRIILYHSFKDSYSPNVVVSSPLQNKALIGELTFETLDFTQVVDSHGWTLFEFSTAVSWAKLAELSLCCFAGFSSYTDRAMASILKEDGIFGPGKNKPLVRAEPEDIRCSRQCIRTTMDGKSKICFALAKALITRLGRSSSKKYAASYTTRTSFYSSSSKAQLTRNLEAFPKIENPLAIMAIKKCGIRFGAHSVYLEKTSKRSYSHGSAIRWLIEFSIECGLWGLRCLINSHSDINDFMQHEEAINLCKNILKKRDDSMMSVVKEILLSLLRQAVRTEATDNIRDIIVTCRENHREASYVLTPWVCQHIHDMALYDTVHFESLMFASEQVFKCYNHKLNQMTTENQKMKASEGGLGLKRLFNEGRDDSDSEEPTKTRVPLNPYITPKKPHPYLELSFELGLMGLNALARGNENPLRRYGRSERDKKERLQEFCQVVCYIATKKWLDMENKQGERLTERLSASSSKGSCRDIDESYITRFVTDLIKSVTNPMYLLSFFREMSTKLFPELDEQMCKNIKSELDMVNKIKRTQLLKAINTIPSLLLLIQRIESQFRELLLGPKVTLLVKNITDRRPHSSPKELRPEFEYHDLEEDTLKDTLKAAKEVSEVLDSSGETFQKLISDIQKKHEELKPVLEGILAGEDIPRHREGDLFRNPFFFWPFIQELQFGRRHPLEDWLN